MTFQSNENLNPHVSLDKRLQRQAWELIIPIERTGITSGVSAVEYNDRLFAFYTREIAPNRFKLGYTVLYKNPKNRLIVESINEMPATSVANLRPATAVYDGQLFCFFTATDQSIRFRVLNASAGTSWLPVAVVPHALTVDAPSVVGHGDKLYVALQGTVDGQFYHTELNKSGWKANIPSPHIRLVESPSLCIYNDTPHVTVRGLDGQLYIFIFSDNQWHSVFISAQTDTYGAPALYAWKEYIVNASCEKPSNRYTTELISPHFQLQEHYTTKGSYLSPPCLTNYKGEFYLIGRRPCNDLSISMFNPDYRDESVNAAL